MPTSSDEQFNLQELLAELKLAVDTGNAQEVLILAGILLGSLITDEPKRQAISA